MKKWILILSLVFCLILSGAALAFEKIDVSGFAYIGDYSAYAAKVQTLLDWGLGIAGQKVTITDGEPALSVYTTNTAVTGTLRSTVIDHTVGASGYALTEGLYVVVNSEFITGSWCNAIVGRIDYGTTGSAAYGMAAPICAELNLPAQASPGGAYYCFDAELEIPTGHTMNLGTSFPVAFIKFGLWGDASSEFDDHGYIFDADGLVNDTGNVLYNNTLRVLVGTTEWYLPLSDTEGSYTTDYPVAISNLVTIVQPTPDLATETNLLDIDYVTGISFPGVTHKCIDLEIDHTGAYAGGNLIGAFIKLGLSGDSTISGLTTPLYCAIDAGATTSLGTAYALVLEYSDDGNTRIVKPTGFIRFGDKDTDAATQVGLLFDIGAQNAMPVGTDTGQIYYNDTLRIQVNADTRFIPLSSVEGTYTTDFPVVSTYGGSVTTSTNAFDSTITDPNIDTDTDTCYGFSATINSTDATGWGNGIVAPIFGHLKVATLSPGTYATGAAGWFILEYDVAETADGIGLTTGLYVKVLNEIAARAPCSVLYLEDITTGDGDARNMPMIIMTSQAGETADKSPYAFSFGFAAAGTTVGSGTGEMFYGNTIKCVINGTDYFMPFSTEEANFTTAYPIVATYGSGSAASANSIAVTVTDPAIDGGTETIYGVSATINSTDSGGWTGGYVAPIYGFLNVATLSPGDYASGAAGWFKLEYDSALTADGVGLTSGVYITTDNQVAGKAPCAVLYLEDEVSGSGVSNSMPILVLTSKGTDNNKSRIAISFGFPAAGTTVSAGTEEIFYGNTIRCRINGTMMYLPFSTAEATFTTAYPIVSTYGGTAYTQTSTLTGAAADNAMQMTITDETVFAGTDYSRGFYINYTNTGIKTGLSEVNGMGIDINTSANTISMYGISLYTGACNGAVVNRVAGIYTYMDEVTGTVTSVSCLHLESASTAATNNDFISMRAHGLQDSMIACRAGGDTATYFLYFAAPAASAPVEAFNAAGNGDYSIKCYINGEITYIHTYDSP